MTRKEVIEDIKRWFKKNYKFGIQLGYPKCCVRAFCMDSPKNLKYRKIRPVDEYRLMAAYYNGEYTGFIPCAYHAIQVYNGEVQLPHLIKNRSAAFGQFPHLHKINHNGKK